MPRIRTIKPEFATDEKLARVSRDARLTFVLCITQADDDGLLPANPRQLLAALFPLDDRMTDQILAYLLKELVDAGRLRWRETVDGSPIIQVVNWHHQKIAHPGKSLILPNLKPIHETLARVSRGTREVLTHHTSTSTPIPVPTTNSPSERAATAPPRPPRVKPKRAPFVWMGEMNRAWKGTYGGDLPLGSATLLAPVVGDVGPEEAVRRLEAYCQATDAEYASVRTFASKHGAYADDGPGKGGMVDPATGVLTDKGIQALTGKRSA